MLSSKQIEIFYQVYKNNSVTAAAQILSISQPSVSKTLKIIEKNSNAKEKEKHDSLEVREIKSSAPIEVVTIEKKVTKEKPKKKGWWSK